MEKNSQVLYCLAHVSGTGLVPCESVLAVEGMVPCVRVEILELIAHEIQQTAFAQHKIRKDAGVNAVNMFG